MTVRVGRDSSVVTDWTALGSNPTGGIFRTRRKPPIQWVPSDTWKKTAGVWHLLPTPSSAEIKERVEFFLYSPLGFCGLIYGKIYIFFIVR
jgi:hypothetical protein